MIYVIQLSKTRIPLIFRSKDIVVAVRKSLPDWFDVTCHFISSGPSCGGSVSFSSLEIFSAHSRVELSFHSLICLIDLCFSLCLSVLIFHWCLPFNSLHQWFRVLCFRCARLSMNLLLSWSNLQLLLYSIYFNVQQLDHLKCYLLLTQPDLILVSLSLCLQNFLPWYHPITRRTCSRFTIW